VRRSLAWLIAVPTMLVGTQAAHALAYRLVFPQVGLRATVLAATGHAYVSWLPVVLAAAGAAALAGVGAAAYDVAHGRRVRELGPATFALLPPLAFALQELLELSLHTGSFAWHAFGAPTFLPGLALQLPFAVLAYLAARLLLRVAEGIGRLLTRPHRLRTHLVFRNVRNLVETGFHVAAASPRAPPFVVA
jgi:hypothetical protein